MTEQSKDANPGYLCATCASWAGTCKRGKPNRIAADQACSDFTAKIAVTWEA